MDRLKELPVYNFETVFGSGIYNRLTSRSVKKSVLFIGFLSLILLAVHLLCSLTDYQYKNAFGIIENIKVKLIGNQSNEFQREGQDIKLPINCSCHNEKWNKPNTEYEVNRREIYRGVQEMWWQ